MKVLSINAGLEKGTWEWNNWYKVGEISKEEFEKLNTNRKLINWFREKTFISEYSKGKVAIDDDGYHIVVIHKNTLEPLYAIEYGPEY